jgi:hypothetical protein
MKKIGKTFTDGDIEEFHSMVVELKKLGIRFHVDGNIIWFFDNELDKLPTDGAGSSFYEISDDVLDL